MKNWKDGYKNKTVMVTGSCGTVGAEIVHQLLELGVAFVRGIDNNEEQLFYQQVSYKSEPRFSCQFVDIKSLLPLTEAFRGVDIIIHSAALKQVPVCEEAPDGAVETNIIGVQNVIQAARLNDVERVLFTSSDKAVNPTNVMGTSKLMGERLISAANAAFSVSKTIFASTRFGNVGGSKGSVIPVFVDQIKRGVNITLTSPEMSRFMMTNDEACNLVLQSAIIAKGGEVFVTKMPVVSIKQLAEILRDRVCPVYGREPKDIDIEIVGARPGEKDYEELTTQEEIRRTLEGERLLIVIPAYSAVYTEIDYTYDFKLEPSKEEFNSFNITPISDDELNILLDDIGVAKV